MEDLIKALQIFLKYGNPYNPTHCVHDILLIHGINVEDVTEEDKAALEQFDFFVSSEYDCFGSFRFGSA